MFLTNRGFQMSRKQMVHVAVNTDEILLESTKEKAKRIFSVKPSGRLRERNVRHIRLSSSSDLKDVYNFGEKIGQGGFGTVVSVVERSTDLGWAMKIVSKAAVGTKISAIQKEIHILKMVDHPHIIYLDRVYESMQNIYMVLEKCIGTLSNVYNDVKPFSEEDTRIIITDLTSAVAYLHKHDIVHRDLKLENILIAKSPTNRCGSLYIKVTDFGLSTVKRGSGYEDMLKDCCGTLHYMAPEIVTKHTYSQLCDVWAVGVIMYALLKGEFPFDSSGEQELTTLISNQEPQYVEFNCSREALHLLSRMLVKNPALRITAGEITEHPWIVGKAYKPEQNQGENVLDMMRLWRTELMLPAGDECDWVSCANAGASSTMGLVMSQSDKTSSSQVGLLASLSDTDIEDNFESSSSTAVDKSTKIDRGEKRAKGKPSTAIIPSQKQSSQANNIGKRGTRTSLAQRPGHQKTDGQIRRKSPEQINAAAAVRSKAKTKEREVRN